MPFAATWMQLEMIIPSKALTSKKKNTNNIQYHLYVESKYDTREPIYETETDSWT